MGRPLPLEGRTVVVGVSGGIAAYKACELVRWLKTRGAAVVVALTKAGAEFVTPLTFQTLSGNPVVRDLWGDQAPRFDLPAGTRARVRGKVGHVDLGEAADAIVIAPATADVIARIVHGTAPDALTTLVLAARAPVVVCPSMDHRMWEQPAMQDNMRILRARGAIVVDPEHGELASGLEGAGRLAAIETIGEAVAGAVVRRASLEGVRVLVGAGRTEEPVDPVRVLTNRSSGRMGYALAAAARDRGAEVMLVSGPASVDPPLGVSLVRVGTALEMERALRAAAMKADIVLMAAAVADYRPARRAREKLKRSATTTTLDLVPNPDIIAGLVARRRAGQVFVGFALETSDGVRRARAKLLDKGLDLVALNAPEESLDRETNRVTLIGRSDTARLPLSSKREVAEAILDRAIALRNAGRALRAAAESRARTRPVRAPRKRGR